ncbi:histidinol-phosphate transaminase [Pedomonas mirosovicensis]|uniref:histidinol-phosphate transaminase n=1 Tax=Pedomonas mirosovicensis TaxID=2908641 RepID=UPI00216A0CF8|nr:histidinol-phosphate transaminase [Pedomonas mirosovicensis]MCH8684973.1 histidinol-phosphate transaminase [Pedomonas mirosovicensis]
MSLPQPKPWISAIAPYIPGKATTPSGRPAAKLSANESPLGPSPKAVAAMQAACLSAHRYPDGGATVLREAVARHHGIEAERIMCGTGSDEALHLLAHAYCSADDEVMFVRHGFMVYPIAAQRMGATLVEVADRDYTADVDALLAAVTPRTRILYLANPNNPTGTYLAESEINRLHAGLPSDVILVLDAAYAEYVTAPDYESGLKLARTAPNVVTTRTFSKIYGLAAERIGWCYGPAHIIETLHKVRGPFNVTSAGLAGAVAALEDQAWIERARAHNNQWLPWLQAEIEALGLHVVPSQCNFLLIRFPESDGITAEAANLALQEAGYILRWLPGQGLPDCLRLTVGTEEENRGVIAALAAFIRSAQAERQAS